MVSSLDDGKSARALGKNLSRSWETSILQS
jgi:hypothetical protein